MTPKELETLLDGQELIHTIDVKTLVLDTVKQLPQEDILDLFWNQLPDISEEQLKDYFYMRRG